MNIENIKAILEMEVAPSIQEQLIISELAKDPNVIPTMLSILQHERETKEELFQNTNAELSRALVTIIDENYGKKGAYIDRIWVAGEIKKHFLKWKDFTRCNFKIDGLP